MNSTANSVKVLSGMTENMSKSIFKGKEDRQGGKKDVSIPNKKIIKRAFFITYQ